MKYNKVDSQSGICGIPCAKSIVLYYSMEDINLDFTS